MFMLSAIVILGDDAVHDSPKVCLGFVKYQLVCILDGIHLSTNSLVFEMLRISSYRTKFLTTDLDLAPQV